MDIIQAISTANADRVKKKILTPTPEIGEASKYVLEVLKIRQAARYIVDADMQDLIIICAETEYSHLQLLVQMFDGFATQVSFETFERRVMEDMLG